MKRASIGRALAVLCSLALGSAYVAYKSNGAGLARKSDRTLTPTKGEPAVEVPAPVYFEGSKSGRMITPPAKSDTTMGGSKIMILLEPDDVKKKDAESKR